MTKSIKLLIAGACLVFSATKVNAESSIQYYGSGKGFDKKIEAAALKIAAAKIGEMRGSLKGVSQDYVVTEIEIKEPRTSTLGFPRISDETTGDIKKAQDTVPMV